jgi:hypothetical protein
MNSVILSGSTHECHRIAVLLNATQPVWRRWRNQRGYFVVQQRGISRWVGSSGAGGMMSAFRRWLDADAPLEDGSVIDGTESVLLVAIDGCSGKVRFPGRTI